MSDDARRNLLRQQQQDRLWEMLREITTPIHHGTSITEFTNDGPEDDKGHVYFRRRTTFSLDDAGNEAYVDVMVPAKHALLAQRMVIIFPQAQRAMVTGEVSSSELSRRYGTMCEAFSKRQRTFVSWEPSTDLTDHLMCDPVQPASQTKAPGPPPVLIQHPPTAVRSAGPIFPPGIHHIPQSTWGQAFSRSSNQAKTASPVIHLPGTNLTLTRY